jgi:flagellar hook assembly protein FlgD
LERDWAGAQLRPPWRFRAVEERRRMPVSKVLVAVVAMVVGMSLLSTVYAAEEKAAGKAEIKAQKTIEGVVSVKKDGDAVKEVAIGEGDAKVCVCTSNEQGKKVAEMNGKKVKATGTLAEKEGKKVLTVEKVEEVK